jgi:hypothetical protein
MKPEDNGLIDIRKDEREKTLKELAKELRELDIDNMLDREIAAYILDNYEIKKKPVNGV